MKDTAPNKQTKIGKQKDHGGTRQSKETKGFEISFMFSERQE